MSGLRLRDLLLNVEAAASGGTVTTAPRGRAACRHGLGEDLEVRKQQGCQLHQCAPVGTVGRHVGAAAQDVVQRSWSMCGWPEQRELQVVVSFGVSARGTAVACPGGGAGRWCGIRGLCAAVMSSVGYS